MTKNLFIFLTDRAAFLCFVVVCFSLFISPQLSAAAAVEFEELYFFEGDRDIKLPLRNSPQINNVFDRGSSRYIFSVVRLKNDRWNETAQDVIIKVRYLRSDGSLFGEANITHHVPADWEYATLWTGWGWDIQGNWDTDNYKVELWLDGAVKIGEEFFQVTSGPDTVPIPGDTFTPTSVAFDKMGFFEASAKGSDQAPEEWKDSRLKNTFPKNETRYIFTLISLRNLQWQKQDQDISINLRYYHSDGRLLSEPVIDFRILAKWEHANLWNGWGWPEAGKWEADRYRVELWLDNKRKIGERYFTVHLPSVSQSTESEITPVDLKSQ